jgi:1-acyl-sn-glycerol-3-phosphate acyltransferase
MSLTASGIGGRLVVRRRAPAPARGAGEPSREELAVGSPLRGAVRLAAYLGLTFSLIPVQALGLALGRRGLVDRLPVFYHRLCCRIFGLRVEVRGTPSPARPTLFVANHSSYIDIEVLSTVLPVSFVAKAEVAGWPLFGLLAKLQRTVFVDRRRGSTREQRDGIAERLAAGDNLVLFPEGTSNDGNRLLPFRSALFSVAERPVEGQPLMVQPVSLAYTRLDGFPLGYAMRPLIAWYGDMAMGGHLWRLVGLGKLTAVVEFHPPVTIEAFRSRKAMAEHCHRQVSRGVAAALAGRPAPAAGAAESSTNVKGGLVSSGQGVPAA